MVEFPYHAFDFRCGVPRPILPVSLAGGFVSHAGRFLESSTIGRGRFLGTTVDLIRSVSVKPVVFQAGLSDEMDRFLVCPQASNCKSGEDVTRESVVGGSDDSTRNVKTDSEDEVVAS